MKNFLQDLVREIRPDANKIKLCVDQLDLNLLKYLFIFNLNYNLNLMENPQTPIESGGNNTINDGKNIAIIAYLTIIGLIIAFVLNNEKRNDFATYHIRQSLGIFLTLFVSGILSYIPFIGWIISVAAFFLMIILWIIGIINAANGNKKPVPLLGEYYNNLFAGI